MTQRTRVSESKRKALKGLTASLLAAGLLSPGISAQAAGKDNVFPGNWLSSTALQLTPPPEGREGYCAGRHGNEVITTHGFTVFGDTGDVRIYDTAANTWRNGTSSPNPRSEGVGVTQDGLVYCLGGRSLGVSSLVEAYDSVNDTWTLLNSMPTARAGLAAAVRGSKIFTFGGNAVGAGPCSGPALNVAEVYDIPSGTWDPITPPPIPVTHALAQTKGNKIYLIGGCQAPSGDLNPSAVLNAVQIYDTTTDTWAAGAPMPTPRASFALGTLGNTLYAMGGWNAGTGNLSIVEAYDVDKNTWSGPLTPKTTASSENFAVAHDATLYVVGSGSFGLAAKVFEAFSRK
jgi:N-acetylneuraminic acid mutarotase